MHCMLSSFTMLLRYLSRCFAIFSYIDMRVKFAYFHYREMHNKQAYTLFVVTAYFQFFFSFVFAKNKIRAGNFDDLRPTVSADKVVNKIFCHIALDTVITNIYITNLQKWNVVYRLGLIWRL